MRHGNLRPAWLWLALVPAVVMMASSCSKRTTTSAALSVEPVQRRDIAVTIEATGTVEPVDLVEVKSKASGQILRMPVEIGSRVEAGQLLAQIDMVDVRNAYEQAAAALEAARTRAEITAAQKKRSDDLFQEAIITAQEHETALLDFANAQSQLVSARAELDNARQRRDDATVRAPIAGTVLSQSVTAGQVISSGTSSVSGGTALLTMADLSRIRMRAMVSESDIGQVKPGQAATVTVESFPQRPFEGRVEKIEPRAVVQQSVTMFPVLVSIENRDGILLPGMNGEIALLVAERRGVLAVPVDAVRTAREVPSLARTLGLDPDSLKAGLARMAESRGPRSGGVGGAMLVAGGSDTTRRRRGAGGDSTGRRGAGVDSTRRRAGAGADTTRRAATMARGPGRAERAQIVFVRTAGGIELRAVRTGLGNFDFVEILSGVAEGDEVVLLGVAELQSRRTQDQERMRQRLGSGMPGQAGGGTGGGRTGGTRPGGN